MTHTETTTKQNDDGSWNDDDVVEDDNDDEIDEKKSNNIPGKEDAIHGVEENSVREPVCDISPSTHSAMCATEFHAYFCRCSLIINNNYEGFGLCVCVFGSLKSDTAHSNMPCFA